MPSIVNHTDGELTTYLGEGNLSMPKGEIVNHNTTEAAICDGKGTFGQPQLVNHAMADAAPNVDQISSDAKAAFGRDLSAEAALAKKLGLHRYPGRVLGSTHPRDILCLHPELNGGNWGWMEKHYDRIGLPHAKEVVWDDSLKVLADHPDRQPSVFFFGRDAHSARPDPDWFEVVRWMNSKNNFIQIARKFGCPVPDTICFQTKSEIDDLNQFSFPCFLKLDVSVSGLGVVRCDTSADLEKELSNLAPDIPFQIQAALDNAITFINLQYFSNGHNLKRVIATEQVLEGNSHAGNRFPTIHQPWDLTDPIAHEMFELGMKGFFAFDLAVIPDGQGSFTFAALECNPRWNGATYPTNIAAKLDLTYWVAKNFHTSFNHLSHLDLGALEFDPQTQTGVVIVNWGPIIEKKLGVLLAGPPGTQTKLEDQLHHLLS